jgi:hypothetical protein
MSTDTKMLLTRLRIRILFLKMDRIRTLLRLWCFDKTECNISVDQHFESYLSLTEHETFAEERYTVHHVTDPYWTNSRICCELGVGGGGGGVGG